jgi:hypothetical protein
MVHLLPGLDPPFPFSHANFAFSAHSSTILKTVAAGSYETFLPIELHGITSRSL